MGSPAPGDDDYEPEEGESDEESAMEVDLGEDEGGKSKGKKGRRGANKRVSTQAVGKRKLEAVGEADHSVCVYSVTVCYEPLTSLSPLVLQCSRTSQEVEGEWSREDHGARSQLEGSGTIPSWAVSRSLAQPGLRRRPHSPVADHSPLVIACQHGVERPPEYHW